MNKHNIEVETRKKARKFEELFSSPLGMEVLTMLEAEFDIDELRAQSVENTYFNIGRRDVVVYINQLINYSER